MTMRLHLAPIALRQAIDSASPPPRRRLLVGRPPLVAPPLTFLREPCANL
jgi:hypothetical protein